MQKSTQFQTLFPDDDEDGESPRKFGKAIHWRDLPQNQWFLISRQHVIASAEAQLKILQLTRRDSTVFDVWTTHIISQSIDQFRKKHLEHSPHLSELFIKSIGKKSSKSHPSRAYFDVQLKYM